jgi:HEAT repeat protein
MRKLRFNRSSVILLFLIAAVAIFGIHRIGFRQTMMSQRKDSTSPNVGAKAARVEKPGVVPSYEGRLENQSAANNEAAELIELLNKGSEEQKKEAAARLAELGTPQAVKALLQQLETDSTNEVRLALLSAVSNLESEQSVDMLIACLGRAGKYDVREAARSSLTNNKSPQAVVELLTAMKEHLDDQWLVRDVAKVFRGYHAPELVPQLRQGLMSADSAVEAELCAEGLANIGGVDAGSALISAALNSYGEKRKAIVLAISHLSDLPTIRYLVVRSIPSEAKDVHGAIEVLTRKLER